MQIFLRQESRKSANIFLCLVSSHFWFATLKKRRLGSFLEFQHSALCKRRQKIRAAFSLAHHNAKSLELNTLILRFKNFNQRQKSFFIFWNWKLINRSAFYFNIFFHHR